MIQSPSQDASIPDTDGDSASENQILDAKKVEQYLSVYQSSSPSYILIASMENCVRYMAEKGAGEMARYGARLRDDPENWRS